jgi:hypothetical protein
LRSLGHPWLLPSWVTPLEYGSVAATGAMVLWYRLTRPDVPRYSTDSVL